MMIQLSESGNALRTLSLTAAPKITNPRIANESAMSSDVTTAIAVVIPHLLGVGFLRVLKLYVRQYTV